MRQPNTTRNSTATTPQVLEFWGRATNPQRWQAVLDHARPAQRILDLGAGRGAYTDRLRELGFKATGVDLHTYPEWASKPCGHFITASASALPFEDSAFDMTIAFEVLEHCPDPRAVLAEIWRCTRHTLILSVPNCDLDNALRRHDLALAHWTDRTHCNFFTRTSVTELLTEMGWEVKEVSDCYKVSPNSYFWDTVRLPRRVARALKRLFERFHLVETYWSSILVVAERNDQNEQAERDATLLGVGIA